MITVHDIWQISPKSHVAIEYDDKPFQWYRGFPWGKRFIVEDMRSESWPCHKSVIIVRGRMEESAE